MLLLPSICSGTGLSHCLKDGTIQQRRPVVDRTHGSRDISFYTFFRSILETVHVVWKQCSQFRQYGIVHPYSKVSQFIRNSEDVFEKSAINFGDSAHRIRRKKVLFRRSAALRQTFQIRHNAKRIRQCSCNFDNKF